MKNRETTIKIVIHGTELAFRTDDPDYIHELARFVEDQIKRVESLVEKLCQGFNIHPRSVLYPKNW